MSPKARNVPIEEEGGSLTLKPLSDLLGIVVELLFSCHKSINLQFELLLAGILSNHIDPSDRGINRTPSNCIYQFLMILISYHVLSHLVYNLQLYDLSHLISDQSHN